MKKLIIILMAILLISLIFVSGCSEITKITDPCKAEYDECNYGCGEGWGSGLCKTSCSSQYSQCKKNK